MKQKGFTLVEILFVLAIITILSAAFTLSFRNFRNSQTLKNTMDSALSLLYEARSNTLSGLNNTVYSVNFEQAQMTLVQGATYTSGASSNRVVTYDTGVTMSANTFSDGGSIISFTKLTGTASPYGTLTLSAQNGATKTITIDASGSISHN